MKSSCDIHYHSHSTFHHLLTVVSQVCVCEREGEKKGQREEDKWRDGKNRQKKIDCKLQRDRRQKQIHI